jgi:exopolysaccharide biosynthesis polyprenyl glycosylphosphotransferase
MNNKQQTFKYLFIDLLSAVFSWTYFFIWRKECIESKIFGEAVNVELDKNFFIGVICIPVFWISFYTITGYYNQIYRKSRLKELTQTLGTSVLGNSILFFTLILNDYISSYRDYYMIFFVLLGVHFVSTWFLRFLLTTSTARKIHSKQIGFNTLIIGAGEAALSIYDEINSLPKSPGNIFKGLVVVNAQKPQTNVTLDVLGSIDELEDLVKYHQIEEIIIALDKEDEVNVKDILSRLSKMKVIIKMIPDMSDIVRGSVKINSIFGAALIEISFDIMPKWQQFFKRSFDICIALLFLIIGSPVYLFTALMVKQSSKGPIFFKQERIGHHGMPFNIIKFRSMFVDAEKDGPQLSSQHDSRITSWGKIMRKTRLDEIPQFYNVLIGEMSIVGPRPERQFFIDQIMEKAPHYYHLTKIKPGITSWGQVKFGYAENVDEMVERLKFDLIYLENMSLLVDIKILIYTIMIVFQGRGK